MKKFDDTLPSLCPKRINLDDYILQVIFLIEKNLYKSAFETMKTFTLTIDDIKRVNKNSDLSKFEEYLLTITQ